MDILILLIRIAIVLTFLILAAGGPYAIVLLRRFIKRYTVAHADLETRVQALERWKSTMEKHDDGHR